MLPLLTAVPGNPSAVDTSSITSPEVIEELKKDDDKGVTARQGMVDLKEREAETAALNAAKLKEDAQKEQAELDAQRKQNEADRARAVAEKEGVAALPPEERAEKQGELERKEQELDEADKALDERQLAVDKKEEEARKQEDLSERKMEEAQAERQAIAADQASLIQAQNDTTPRAPVGILALRLVGGDGLAMPVSVDAGRGTELKRGGLNTVYARSWTVTQDGRAFAIAADSPGGTSLKLIEIDKTGLGMAKSAGEEAARGDALWLNGTNLYTLIKTGGGVNVARYSLELAQAAVSAVPVHPQAVLVFTQNRIITQNADGSALLLDPQTLK
jgi:hypothetical protein